MARGIIRFDDHTGNLVPGKVWLMDLAASDLHYGVVYGQDGGRDDTLESKECSLDKRHVTRREYPNLIVDLFGSGGLADFVPWGFPLAIISDRFAKRLSKTKLTGYRIKSIVQIYCNQSPVADPKLSYLEFAGQGGLSNRLIVERAPNLCPHCGMTPMVCPVCGATNWPTCVHCEQWTLFHRESPEYSHPKGFVLEGYSQNTEIVDGKAWDGSDFFEMTQGAAFVSNRAKEWMERTHTYPVRFEPALLNIEGVEDKFKED